MNRAARFARKHLPEPLLNLVRRLLGRKTPPALGMYRSVTLTDQEIEEGTYKEHLGGGSESWDTRGAFQLFFLEKMGMHKNSHLLDIGCGPGRASRHLINFLDSNRYHGVDYNSDFIKAARIMSAKNGLEAKCPVFEVVQDFNFSHIDPVFDYAIVFSVLNHCTPEQKAAFFEMIHRPLRNGGKAYITHATWFNESFIENTNMQLSDQFDPDDFDISKFGWNDREEIFPIIELTKVQ